MILKSVMAEVSGRLDSWQGVHAYPWAVPRIGALPAALVTLPDRIEYDQTFGRGLDRMRDLTVMLLVGRASERAALDNLAAYCDGSGTKSVKARLESFAWTTCDVLTVTSVDFPDASVGDVAYLAAQFHLDIAGHG
jgi:hypothetical protein